MPNPVRSYCRAVCLTLLGVLTLSCGGAGGDSGGTGPTPNPVPVLSSLSRDTITAGATPFVLTVKGTKFVAGLVGLVDSVPRTTNRTNDSTATITLVAADVSVAGDRQVRVANLEPGGGASGALPLHVLPAPPVPTLDSITPSAVERGILAFTLHAFGSGFTPTSVIRWGVTPLVTVHNSSTHLTATVSASLVADSGTVQVTISTPAPGGGTSTARLFAIEDRPVVTRVDTVLLKNRPDTVAFPIHGSSLTGTDTVDLIQHGTSRYLPAVASTDTLVVTTVDRSKLIPYGQVLLRIHAHGVWSDTIYTPKLVGAPLVTVSATSPDTFRANEAEDTITVTGQSFTSHSKIRIGLVQFAETFLDSTHVRGVIDEGHLLDLAGPATLTVFDEMDSTVADSIPIAIWSPAPVIDSVVPGAVAVGSPTRLIGLISHNLSQRGTVRINGVEGTISHGNSGGGAITIILDSTSMASPDTLVITFTNPDPAGGPADTAYLPVVPQNPTPTTDSISIDHVVAGQAPVITLYGHGFVPGIKVEYLVDGGNFDIAHSVLATWIDSTRIAIVIPDSAEAAGSIFLLQTINPEPTPGPSRAPSVYVWSTGIREVTTVVTGTVQELIGDDRRGIVYATLGYLFRGFDVHTHLIANSLTLPMAPTRAVMGGDSNSVWVSGKVTGARAYRIDLDAWAIVDSIVSPLGNSGFSDILALPGQANAVVVSKTVIDTLTGGSTTVLAVFDGEIQRPDTIQLVDAFQFAGFAGGDTLVAMVAGSIFRALVDSTGLHEVSSFPIYLNSPARATLSGSGILYGLSLYNATTGAAIHQYYPWGATSSADDPAHHRMIVVTRSAFGDNFTQIFTLDPVTGALGAPEFMSAQGLVGPFTRFGPDGVAFSDGSARVVFVRAAAIEN